ncbi:hypothetical protein [Oerskovia jenensis]|uniref:hypothetical protein n=1 Tax=Oerskovia jenensis TaxID=162169 RepID=UPI0036DE7C20
MLAKALNDADEEQPRLRLRAASITFCGAWRGDRPVRTGDIVHVELELPRPRRWSDLLSDSKSGGLEGPQATLHGRIEAVDGEVVIARVEDVLLQIELLNAAPVSAVGIEIEIAADDLEFFPTGI